MEENTKGKMRLPHYWLEFYFLRCLYEQGQLDVLHHLIKTFLPKWSQNLSVGKEERDSCAGRIGGKTLFQAIQEFAPERFGLGDAVLSGSYQGLWIYLSSSKSKLPPDSNHLSIEIIDREEVDGHRPSVWASEFFQSLVAALPVRYGNVHLNEEFEAKNIDRTTDATRAIGVKLSKSLPGLYWLNFFGPEYIRLIGEQRLLTVPAHDARRVGEGVMVSLDSEPMNWKLTAYRNRETEVMNHIGKEFFFLRDEQEERETKAPNFRQKGL